ncbi:MAG TPA: DUF2284 domain-containing protein [Syntrophorhabdaceae bacterium]|jgi:predicted metal-binding protein
MKEKPATPGTLSAEELIAAALDSGAAHAAVVETHVLKFDEMFRRLCEQNKCGHYGKNLMCPPRLGEYHELVQKVRKYSRALIFQTVHPLKSSLDIRGMHKGGIAHEQVVRKIRDLLGEKYGMTTILALSAGPCRYCPECGAKRDEPCGHPEKALPSLEAHGIDVSRLLEACAIPYHHGKNTVSFVGGLFFSYP